MAKARKSNIIAALDIGSSKIVCFIALRESVNKLRIVGIGHQISQGIQGGLITDMQAAETSILSAISAAEQMSGQTIDKAIINISGNSIKSNMLHVESSISGHEVTDADIDHITSQAFKNYNNAEREIIHCIPTQYTIDDSSGIKNPRGMFGEMLSTDLHVVTASSTYIRNLANCLAICRLDIEDCMVSSYASGIACLTDDEKNLGAAVIDIGGGNTSVGVFLSGNFIHTESMALGGMHITKDLARGLCTSISYAERLKTLYGSAIDISSDKEEIIDVPVMNDTMPAGTQIDIESGFTEDAEVNHISKQEIVSIIAPRVEEILEIAKKNLESKGFDEIANRIVLTGGTSMLGGIRELAMQIFQKPVRLARPFQIDGLAESTKGPAFSTCIGMLQHAVKAYESGFGTHLIDKSRKQKTGAGKLLAWINENL